MMDNIATNMRRILKFGKTHSEKNSLEGNGWHVMTTGEFADMIGISEHITRDNDISYRDHPLFHTLFLIRNAFYLRDDNGNLINVNFLEPSYYRRGGIFFHSVGYPTYVIDSYILPMVINGI